MAKKISDLTSATTPLDGTELVEIVQGGVSKKVAAGALTAASASREKLTADRTYYVRSDGGDSNTGLTNTSGGAFLTIQKAVDLVSETLDLCRKNVTIQIADGTYTGAVVMRPLVGAVALTVKGNSGTPSNVVISTTSANCFSNPIASTVLTVNDLKVQTTTSGSGLVASAGGQINYSNLVFGAVAGYHITAQGSGRILCNGNYSITGGALGHWFANGYGYLICASRTITLTGTPAFSSAFASCNTPGGMEINANTFSGSATGKRYIVQNNGVIYTNGGGATYLPGNVAGDTPTNGGQYI